MLLVNECTVPYRLAALGRQSDAADDAVRAAGVDTRAIECREPRFSQRRIDRGVTAMMIGLVGFAGAGKSTGSTR